MWSSKSNVTKHRLYVKNRHTPAPKKEYSQPPIGRATLRQFVLQRLIFFRTALFFRLFPQLTLPCIRVVSFAFVCVCLVLLLVLVSCVCLVVACIRKLLNVCVCIRLQ